MPSLLCLLFTSSADFHGDNRLWIDNSSGYRCVAIAAGVIIGRVSDVAVPPDSKFSDEYKLMHHPVFELYALNIYEIFVVVCYYDHIIYNTGTANE